MKNKFKTLCAIAALFTLVSTGCNRQTNDETVESVTPTVIAPSGTPSLGLANYFATQDTANYQIVDGSDPLVAAFQNAEEDVIVAPINLGAKMYKANQHYLFYKTIVWGNLYVSSFTEISSISDLSGKTLYVNGTNGTPDIVVKALLAANSITDCTLEYVDSVSTCNQMLLAGSADYVISAEPSISKVKQTATSKGKGTIYTLDLQDEWQNAFGTSSYPQAGIFVKNVENAKALYNSSLEEMKTAVTDAVADPATCAKNAVAISETFSTLGESVLTTAIPNCHYAIKEHSEEKAAIENYFNQMSNLGLSAQFGGSLPVDEFYY